MTQLEVLEEAIEENTEGIEDTNSLHIELRVYHLMLFKFTESIYNNLIELNKYLFLKME